jgi:N-acetylglucosamine kinase-like BadF-type ATPase
VERGVVLGVDAGFSKTDAAVCDASGRVRGKARTGRGSVEGPGGVIAGVEEMERAVRLALMQAGVAVQDVAAAVYGVAGADSPEDVASIAEELVRRGLPSSPQGMTASVVNDGLVALRGGARRTWGVVSSAGSGHVVVGRSPQGRVVQVGGLGELSGDRGGGADLGRQAVRAVLMAEQGALPPTRLRAAVVAWAQSSQLREILLHPPPRWWEKLPQLAPAVFEAAQEGDEAAQDILLACGREMGRMAAGAAVLLGMQHLDVEVVLAGGTYASPYPLLVDAVTLEVHRRLPRARVHRAYGQPVAGALLMAAEAAGWPAPASFQATLWEGLPGLASPPA